MPHKRLLFKSAAREKVLRGATALADSVRGTLGPRAQCVIIEKKWGRPLISDDGVTIAREVDLEDAEENLGAQVLREAAERTGDAVGDGTTRRRCSHTRSFQKAFGMWPLVPRRSNFGAGSSADWRRRSTQSAACRVR
jgi:chaperonin GroEL (HSP60 family)